MNKIGNNVKADDLCLEDICESTSLMEKIMELVEHQCSCSHHIDKTPMSDEDIFKISIYHKWFEELR